MPRQPLALDVTARVIEKVDSIEQLVAHLNNIHTRASILAHFGSISIDLLLAINSLEEISGSQICVDLGDKSPTIPLLQALETKGPEITLSQRSVFSLSGTDGIEV